MGNKNSLLCCKVDMSYLGKIVGIAMGDKLLK
jgi:hypothetical protein